MSCNGSSADFELVTHERHQVGGGDSLLAVGQTQEALVRLVELVLVQSDADLLNVLRNPALPECLPSTRRVPSQPTSVGSMISYVVRFFSMPSWWMPASWANAFAPNDRLVRLNRNAGQSADESADRN